MARGALRAGGDTGGCDQEGDLAAKQTLREPDRSLSPGRNKARSLCFCVEVGEARVDLVTGSVVSYDNREIYLPEKKGQAVRIFN